jgi:hypothetical protein
MNESNSMVAGFIVDLMRVCVCVFLGSLKWVRAGLIALL